MKSKLHQELEEHFQGKKGAYVLITCEEGFDGSLAVEMSHSSEDPVLTSCLLSNAQAHLSDEIS